MLATDDKYRASQAKGKNAEDESRMIEKLTYKCLISLAEGDNPSLAGDLIVHTIIERPDASSWHRQLLGLGFFKRLPARNAETLLLHFSKAIGEKLEEQAYDRIGEAVGTPSIVKVTTVKYLAQILQNAEFLSLEASIDVLLELFKVATHPDIRIATLDSMIASLENLALSEVKESIHDISNIQNPLIRKILLALNTVIPVVGSINERTPPKEQDWIEAAEDLSKLPKPIECQIIRPLWSRLLYSAETSKKFKAYFIQNLLIPAMKVSISEHRRWLALFLKKYNAGFGIDELPSFVPSNRQIIGNLLTRFNQSIPAYVLKGWNEYVAFSLEKPMFLSRFISSLEADEENRVKVDVKHFLAIFDYPVIQIVQDETNRLIDIVHHNWKPSILPDQQGITLQQLQAIILQQLRLIILNYDKNFTLWASLIRYFRHPTGSKADYERWKKDFRPIMRNLINMIEGMRTPQWLSSPDRRPAILPSISLLRLWALNYPQPDSTATQSDSQSFELGQELLEFVEEHFSDFSKALNREKFMTEIMTVSEKLNDRQNVRIALVFLGTDQKSNVVVAIVRAELALRFLAKGRKTLEKDIKARDGVTRLINLWKDSPVEDIRELVLDLQMSSGHDSLWDIIVSSKAN